ncbi:MAG: hypothetical protein SangKO_089430 [Sandaracinaceae bacterium]
MRCLPIAVALALAACEPGPGTLIVELRTDLTPGMEIDTALTALDPGGAIGNAPMTTRGEGPTRVAQVPDLAPGRYRLSVTVTRGGESIATRTMVFRHDGPRILTVVIPRSCAGVTCDETTETCIRGGCGSLECVEGTEASCPPPECAADADCAPVASCADARCVGGTCVAEARPDACEAAATCSAVEGCVGAAPPGPVFELECAGGAAPRNAAEGPTPICDGASCPSHEAVGPTGSACRFDGIDDVLRVPGLDLAFSGAFTLAGFVEPRTLLDGESMTLLRRPFADAGQSTLRVWLEGRMGLHALGYGGDSGDVISSSTPLAPGGWTHFAMVFDGDGLTLYLDGASPNFATFAGQRTDASDILIGARDAAGMEAFEGWIADLRVYDRALGEAEIAALAR